MTTDHAALVERLAKAFCDDAGLNWATIPEANREMCRKRVRAVLAALDLPGLLTEERKRCAKIADAHKGSAAKKRREKPFGKLGDMEDGLQVEVIAEERGEDIAAEIIAFAIREQGDGG